MILYYTITIIFFFKKNPRPALHKAWQAGSTERRYCPLKRRHFISGYDDDIQVIGKFRDQRDESRFNNDTPRVANLMAEDHQNSTFIEYYRFFSLKFLKDLSYSFHLYFLPFCSSFSSQLRETLDLPTTIH